MAELSTLARPYAKAIFEYAEAADDLQTWSQTLALLSAVAENESVRNLFASPAISTAQQADTLIEVCGDELNDKGRNLVRLLAQNRRLPLLPAIAGQFEALKSRNQRAVDVELVSARPLEREQQDKLVEALSRKLDRTVNVTVSTDESLLGGVLIRAGDTVIDGSIRGRLNKLAEALTS